MKRRVYVISARLYIFCMMNNGQVLTHTLKGRVEAAGDEFPERGYTRQPSTFTALLTDATDVDAI